MIYKLDTYEPVVPASAWIAPGAAVIGQVILGEQVSIWFNAVLRGDNDVIRIGSGSNVQDAAVLHADPGFALQIGERVTVGHKVMLHGCTIGDHSLVGMNAVVLNGAVVGRHCLIGANALLTEGMQVPDGSLVLGSPGKIIRSLDAGARASVSAAAQNYIDKIVRYREALQPAGSGEEHG